MISVVHPTSNANSRNTAMALRNADQLHEFWTCFHWQPGKLSDSIIPEKIKRELYRRTFEDELHGHIRTHPYYELGRQAAQKFKLNTLVKDNGRLSIHRVYKNFSQHVARQLRKKPRPTCIHAYEDGALEIFKQAKKYGIFCLYELPIAYWKYRADLFAEEQKIQPDWAPTLKSMNMPQWLRDRKDEELMLADSIIVPSRFVKESVVRYFPELESKINICAYGAPQMESRLRFAMKKEKIKVLFVGSIGQRKGGSYLFEIFDRISDFAEITIIGNPIDPDFQLGNDLLSKYNYLGSVPHEVVLKEMGKNDVFLLPTLCEGQALVNLEAMGAGMAVITTPNSGADDFIEDGKDGFIIPVRDIDTAVKNIRDLHEYPQHLQQISKYAKRKAKQFSWSAYQERYTSIIESLPFK